MEERNKSVSMYAVCPLTGTSGTSLSLVMAMFMNMFSSHLLNMHHIHMAMAMAMASIMANITYQRQGVDVRSRSNRSNREEEG